MNGVLGVKQVVKNYILTIKTVTPVVIGSGEVLEPYEYVIRDNGRPTLYALDLLNFLNWLDGQEREGVLALIEADIMGFRRKLANLSTKITSNADLQRFAFSVSDLVACEYRDKIANPDNALEISLFVRTLGNPFIPGSSIKGALRTAFVYRKAIANKGFRKETLLLNYKNSFDDPFRTIKIGDSEVVKTQVVKTENRSFKPGKNSGIPALREATVTNFEVKIPISAYPEIVGKSSGYDSGPSYRVEISEIINSCRQFYGELLKAEINFFERNKRSTFKVDLSWVRPLEKVAMGAMGGDCFPLRLGWGTGKLSKTIALITGEKHPISRNFIKKSGGDRPEYVSPGWVLAKIEEA